MKRKKPRNARNAKPKALPKAKSKLKRGPAAAKKAAPAAAASEDVTSPLAMKVEEEEMTQEEVEEEVEEEEEEEDETGGTANVALSIEGGPYEGSVFEITVEEDGDARLVGRSTGKKVRFFLIVFCEGRGMG